MKFITFSRQLGTGGHEIAMRVADKLGYTFHDTESIGHAAREMRFLDSVEQKRQHQRPSRKVTTRGPRLNGDMAAR
jgi:hypothetical protein